MFIKILNDKGRVFFEYFTSPYLLKKRLNKLKYSKKLKVLEYTYVNDC